MKDQITFSQALEGYFLHADARRLSPLHCRDYENRLPRSKLRGSPIRTF